MSNWRDFFLTRKPHACCESTLNTVARKRHPQEAEGKERDRRWATRKKKNSPFFFVGYGQGAFIFYYAFTRCPVMYNICLILTMAWPQPRTSESSSTRLFRPNWWKRQKSTPKSIASNFPFLRRKKIITKSQKKRRLTITFDLDLSKGSKFLELFLIEINIFFWKTYEKTWAYGNWFFFIVWMGEFFLVQWKHIGRSVDEDRNAPCNLTYSYAFSCQGGYPLYTILRSRKSNEYREKRGKKVNKETEERGVGIGR